MTRVFVAGAVLCSLPFVVACGGSRAESTPIASPSPKSVIEGAALAAAVKGEPYSNSLSNDKGAMVLVSTPYSRIAEASKAAKMRYLPFTEDHITPEMVEPEISIWAADIGETKVVAVAVLPRGAVSSAGAMVPFRVERTEETPPGLITTFSLDALSEKNEIRVIYEGEALRFMCNRPGPATDTTECVIPIDMSKIR